MFPGPPSRVHVGVRERDGVRLRDGALAARGERRLGGLRTRLLPGATVGSGAGRVPPVRRLRGQQRVPHREVDLLQAHRLREPPRVPHDHLRARELPGSERRAERRLPVPAGHGLVQQRSGIPQSPVRSLRVLPVPRLPWLPVHHGVRPPLWGVQTLQGVRLALPDAPNPVHQAHPAVVAPARKMSFLRTHATHLSFAQFTITIKCLS